MKRSLQILTKIAFCFTITLTINGCSKKDSSITPTHPATGPTISALSVNQGPYNTSVVISGTNFSSTVASDKVFFNGKAATVTAATATQLTAIVPLGAGTGNVTVSVSDGVVVSGPVFTYQASWIVSTLAGSGTVGSADGIGSAASFNTPTGLDVDKSGNVFVADEKNHLMRKITPDGAVTTIAGTGAAGNVNGVGKSASFNLPEDVVVDANGNVFVADQLNHVIRKITPAGGVSTFAGSGEAGYADGTGTAAKFKAVNGMAIDLSGNILVSDPQNNYIRQVTPAGVVSTFAKGTTFNFPTDVAVDKSGNVYVADLLNYKVRKITPAGGVTDLNRSANNTAFNGPNAVTVDANGNVYIIDGSSIAKVTNANVASNFANSSGLATVNLSLQNPLGIATDTAGNIYVADTDHNKIIKISLQ